MKPAITYLLVLFSIISAIQAQDKVKFGKVSEAEVKMTTYAADTSAVAVILYDKGYFNASDFKFYRHKRIKVLKNAGTSYGNITLNVPSKGFFKALVFNYENGEVIKEKLERSSVFEEELYEGDFSYKLFLPNVKVGSVIDLQYSHFSLPGEWRFQDLIPVAYSELILEESQYVVYKKVQMGFEPITQVKSNQWVSTNVPAFNPEPYLSHYSNYVSKFEFQISSINVPGVFYREYSTTWEIVGKRLLQSDYFGVVINSCLFLNEKAKELKSNAEMSVEEKVTAAYDYIKENIKWNDYNGVYASRAFRENFKKNHSGSVADINLMLIALLRKLDIRAYPVIMSTRANGFINPFSANSQKINYVAAYVEHGDYTKVLDASGSKLVPGVLPAKCLNGRGWVITGVDQGKWIDLNPAKTSEKKQLIQIKLDENGAHTATVSQSNTQYEYLKWTSRFDAAGSEEDFARYIEESYGDLTVEEYHVKKNDAAALKCSEVMQVNLEEYVDDLGNELILNPYIMSNMLKNPFKTEDRKYPVDLNYLTKNSSIISVELPESFSIDKLPQSISMKTPDGGAVFVFRCNQMANKIQIQYQVNLKKTIFSEGEYPALRQFYSVVVDKLSESIQITKRT
ncbi:MAG: DUF3857 domain-containing protein [Cyclobacteriaceae bacterium]|nr:DUF3857 domain-containing protein [Cyclobacteriaceae bacterium HetDA_MAG_MS6]